MTKRYSILVIEHGEEYELCQVDSNPKAIVRAAKAKLQDELPFQKLGAKKYSRVRFVKNPDPNKPLDAFINTLARAQSFRDQSNVTESFAGNGLGNQPGQGGPFVP